MVIADQWILLTYELSVALPTMEQFQMDVATQAEATKEALRMSESDIKRFKEESDITKAGLQKQILEHKEERENLKDKLTHLTNDAVQKKS